MGANRSNINTQATGDEDFATAATTVDPRQLLIHDTYGKLVLAMVLSTIPYELDTKN